MGLQRWWIPEEPTGGQQTQGRSKPDDDCGDSDDDFSDEESYLESNAVEPAVVPQVLLVEVRVRLVLVKDDNDDDGDDSD